MATELQAAADLLDRAIDKKSKAIVSLGEKLKTEKVELAQLRKARQAIEGVVSEPSASSKQSKSSKPCCNKQEVIAILDGLLRDNGSLTKSELESLAKDKLSNDLNKSLSGFAMRLKEALAETQFREISPGTYELAAS